MLDQVAVLDQVDAIDQDGVLRVVQKGVLRVDYEVGFLGCVTHQSC